MADTKHDHGPNFGRREPGCARCAELTAGAAPRTNPGVEAKRRASEADADRLAEIRAHFAVGGPHATGTCGPVCTWGDW